MKFSAVLAVAIVSQFALGAAKIDPKLGLFAQRKTQLKTARVLALMELTVDQRQSPRRYDRKNVPAYLKYLSQKSWTGVEAFLKAQPNVAQSVQIVRGFWINSSFVANVTPEGLKMLAQAPGVEKIYLDDKIVRDPYGADARSLSRSSRRNPFTEAADLPYDLKDIGLDKLIAEYPQLDGRGVLLGHIDTGVDANHPALAGKIVSFYDASKKAFGAPFDGDKHGTHTAGTMVGGDRSTNIIGVAPGAKLVAAMGLPNDGDPYSVELAAMEHMLDPDKNPNTADLPRAVNNSWHSTGAPDMELFYRAITAWETAGILPVFSAGNAGRGGEKTITPPHEHPLAFAVAASDSAGKIADFSSRGPGVFNGQETKKPDISAPGVKIRSSVPGGNYEEFNGTSMAAPHVSGATAILFQINPALTPLQVRQILLRSLTPVNSDGSPAALGQWNSAFGYGKMNLYGAAKMAMAMLNPNPPVNSILGGGGANPLSQGFFSSNPRMMMEANWIARGNRVTQLSQQDFAYTGTRHDRGWATYEQVWK